MHIHPPCPVTVPTLKEVGPTVSEKLRTQNCVQTDGPILGNNHFVLADIQCICNLCLHPHLPILHSNCAKFKRNWCNTIGGVANTRFHLVDGVPHNYKSLCTPEYLTYLKFLFLSFMHIYPSCQVTVPSLKEIGAIV